MNCTNCLHFPYDCAYWQINVNDELPTDQFMESNKPDECSHYILQQHKSRILRASLQVCNRGKGCK